MSAAVYVVASGNEDLSVEAICCRAHRRQSGTPPDRPEAHDREEVVLHDRLVSGATVSRLYESFLDRTSMNQDRVDISAFSKASTLLPFRQR